MMKTRILTMIMFVVFSGCMVREAKNDPDWPFDSFLRIDVKQYETGCDDCLVDAGVGSGTTVGSHEILTAGHICISIKEMRKNSKESEISDVVKVKIQDDEGIQYTINDMVIHDTGDVCIIKTKTPLNTKVIDLAFSNPRRASPVWSLGAPAGVTGPGLIPITSGFFVGGDYKISVFTVPSHPGSSGGPVFDSEGKLVGLISQIHKDFHHLILSPSLVIIKEFLSEQR